MVLQNFLQDMWLLTCQTGKERNEEIKIKNQIVDMHSST